MAARRRRGRPPRSVRCAGRPPPRSLERRLLTRSAHSSSPSPRSPSPSAGRSRLPTTRAALAPLASREGFRPALVRALPPASLSRRETLCHSPSRAAKRSPRRPVAQHPPLAVRLGKAPPTACPLHGASPAPSRPAVHPPARSRHAEPPSPRPSPSTESSSTSTGAQASRDYERRRKDIRTSRLRQRREGRPRAGRCSTRAKRERCRRPPASPDTFRVEGGPRRCGDWPISPGSVAEAALLRRCRQLQQGAVGTTTHKR